MGNQIGRYWTLVIALLVVAIAVGGLMLLLKSDGKDRLEILLSQPAPASEQEVEVYVDGAVAHPGFYLLEGANTIEDVLQAAGGAIGGDLASIKVHVPAAGGSTTPQSQRVNINTAPDWLLDALPGIGPKLAQAIIDYRKENGRFQRTQDLMKVKGIDPETFDKVQGLITAD
jgi:competence protein ComEA